MMKLTGLLAGALRRLHMQASGHLLSQILVFSRLFCCMRRRKS